MGDLPNLGLPCLSPPWPTYPFLVYHALPCHDRPVLLETTMADLSCLGLSYPAMSWPTYLHGSSMFCSALSYMFCLSCSAMAYQFFLKLTWPALPRTTCSACVYYAMHTLYWSTCPVWAYHVRSALPGSARSCLALAYLIGLDLPCHVLFFVLPALPFLLCPGLSALPWSSQSCSSVT